MADTHEQKALELMMAEKGLTSMRAFKFGMTRLSAVIERLRKKGYNIHSKWETTINRYGREVRYVRYILLGEPK